MIRKNLRVDSFELIHRKESFERTDCFKWSESSVMLLFLCPPPNTQSAVMCAKAHQSTDARSERRSSPSPHSYETALGFDVIVRSLRLLRQPVSRTPSPSHPIPTLVGSIMVQAASCSTMVSAQWFSIANSGFNPSLFISTTFLSLYLFDSSSQRSLKPSPTGMFWTEQNWTVTGPGTSDGQLARNGRSVVRSVGGRCCWCGNLKGGVMNIDRYEG